VGANDDSRFVMSIKLKENNSTKKQ
jgi:hypothetical protein